jgi:dipeptidase E
MQSRVQGWRMRLYLSSFRLGNRPDALLDLLDGGRRTAVIVNATDDKTDEERVASYERERADLTDLGLDPYELDLRDHFDRPDALRERLEDIDLLWVRGGNVFVLRRALARCGAEELLIELLAADAFVSAGYNAGAVVLTPSLHGIELVDDPADVPPGYPPEIVWNCLGVVPFHIAPHYRTPEHLESAAIDHVVTYLIDHHLPFIALRDGEALVFDGERKKIVGGRD